MRTTRHLRLVPLLLWISVGTPPAGACAQTPTPLVITRAEVVDVVAGRILPARTVTVREGVIASIVPDGEVARGAVVYDAAGRFLIPGLWDMHAHLQRSGAWALQVYLAHGVTGVRDMGSELDFILEMRERTTLDPTLGPTIVAAGPILDDAPAEWPYRLRVRDAEQGRAAVRMLKERGVDLVKVHSRTPREAYFAIADEARRQGLPLAGHVPLGVIPREAIEAGQSSIEHLSGIAGSRECPGPSTYRTNRCRAVIETLARRGVWQTPTLLAMRELVAIGTPATGIPHEQLPYVSSTMKRLWELNQRASNVTPEVARAQASAADAASVFVSDLQEAGVGILAGCDAMIPGFCLHDELAYMVRGGMAPLDALRTATINPARYLAIQESAGSVEPGKSADLVLLDGNPLEDIGNTRRIHAVVVDGKVLGRLELDAALGKARAQVR